jgi:hypothetical protein
LANPIFGWPSVWVVQCFANTVIVRHNVFVDQSFYVSTKFLSVSCLSVKRRGTNRLIKF